MMFVFNDVLRAVLMYFELLAAFLLAAPFVGFL